LALARDGAKVVVNYQKDSKAAAEVVAAIKNGDGDGMAIQADVTSSTQVDQLFADTKRHYGRIDIVVANRYFSHLFISLPYSYCTIVY
jgi:3-oxoacyl-[acyl-carrier protein] reductase